MAKYELSLTVENANLDVTPEGPVTLSVLELIGPRGETGPQGPTGPAGSTQPDGLTDVDTSNASTGNLLRADTYFVWGGSFCFFDSGYGGFLFLSRSTRWSFNAGFGSKGLQIFVGQGFVMRGFQARRICSGRGQPGHYYYWPEIEQPSQLPP